MQRTRVQQCFVLGSMRAAEASIRRSSYLERHDTQAAKYEPATHFGALPKNRFGRLVSA